MNVVDNLSDFEGKVIKEIAITAEENIVISTVDGIYAEAYCSRCLVRKRGDVIDDLINFSEYRSELGITEEDVKKSFPVEYEEHRVEHEKFMEDMRLARIEYAKEMYEKAKEFIRKYEEKQEETK